MGMQISATELLKMFVFDSDPIATLTQSGVLGEREAKSPSDQFVDMVLDGLKGAQSAGLSAAEFRTRMQLISATVTPSLWKIEAQAGQRLQRYLNEVLAKEGSEPPPSRLGARTFEDLLDGRIADSEFALIIKQHANALFQRLTRLSSMQMAQKMSEDGSGAAAVEYELRQLGTIDISRLIFYAAQAHDLYPETYPEVATLSGILVLRPRFDPEMSDAAREKQAAAFSNLKKTVGEQLGLAWTSRALAQIQKEIFFSADEKRIINPLVQRLEKIIRAAALMGNGIIPTPAEFEDRYEWTRAIVKLIARTKFNEDTVLKVFGDALKFLPDQFGWALSLQAAYGVRADAVLRSPPFDSLVRAREFDSMSHDHESQGDMSRAGVRSHMAAKELIKLMWIGSPEQEIIAASARELLLRANSLYNAAIRDTRASVKEGHSPPLCEEHISALYHRCEEVSHDLGSVHYFLRLHQKPLARPAINVFAAFEEESPLSVAVVEVAQKEQEPDTAPAVGDEDVERAFDKVMDVAPGEMAFTPLPVGSLVK